MKKLIFTLFIFTSSTFCFAQKAPEIVSEYPVEEMKKVSLKSETPVIKITFSTKTTTDGSCNTFSVSTEFYKMTMLNEDNYSNRYFVYASVSETKEWCPGTTEIRELTITSEPKTLTLVKHPRQDSYRATFYVPKGYNVTVE